MQRIPLAERLRKRLHRTISAGQDILVEEVYSSFRDAVLHGGTAILRCYGGNRFSEDVDLYLPHASAFMVEHLVRDLEARGLHKEKLKETENAMFGKFSYAGVAITIEASLRSAKESVLMPFEMLDGRLMMVRTLKRERLVLEKVSAYVARRKVRDLYDIFFLLQAREEEGAVKRGLDELLENFQRPTDEKELRALVISGSVPSMEEMLEAVRKRAR